MSRFAARELAGGWVWLVLDYQADFRIRRRRLTVDNQFSMRFDIDPHWHGCADEPAQSSGPTVRTGLLEGKRCSRHGTCLDTTDRPRQHISQP